jgi:hypothetical protein
MVDDWFIGTINPHMQWYQGPDTNVSTLGFLSFHHDDWFIGTINPHMQWYQGLDPNVSTLGFLSFHHQVQYFSC